MTMPSDPHGRGGSFSDRGDPLNDKVLEFIGTMTSELEASICSGKERFTSPQLARNAAKRRPGRLTYRCPKCGNWHVGTREDKAWRKAGGRPKARDAGVTSDD